MKLLKLLAIAILLNVLPKINFACTKVHVTPTDSLTDKAKNLKQLYLQATQSGGMNDFYAEKFFKEFPSTFGQLNDLYGKPGGKSGILNSNAENHIIKLFNNLATINDTVYYTKIIGIAKGGVWDGDAINFFQHGLQSRVESKPALTVYLLKKMPEKDIRSFWHFYFDGPHGHEEVLKGVDKIKAIDKKMYGIILDAYKAALGDKE